MADPHAHRRALEMRNRAHDLADRVSHERDDGQRRYMRDLVESYRRTADQLDPPSPLAQATNAPMAHLRKPGAPHGA